MIIFPLNKNKAPAVPAGTNWQDYQGEANSALIGVMIPKGIIVLDIDTYKGTTLKQVDDALGVSVAWDLAELQTTMNGGKHYAFKVPFDVDLINGTDILGIKGFDTRSSFKGYIATGKGYENLTLLDTVQAALHDRDYWNELPSSALEKLKVNRSVADVDSDLAGLINSQPLELSHDDVQAYLDKLPDSAADDSATWLKVGMALYHQSEGKEWGWQAFDMFSQRVPEKYDVKMNRKRWESFGKHKERISNPITFASVIDLAGGMSVVAADKFEALRQEITTADSKDNLLKIIHDVAKLKLDELNSTIIVKALQKQFAQVVGEKLSESQVRRIIRRSKSREGNDFQDDYIFLTVTAEYMDRVTKVTMGQRAFDVKHDRDTPLDNEGLPQRASVFVNNKIECVHSGMYAPMFDDLFTYDGVDYFNTFKPNTLKRVKMGTTDIVDRIKGHIAHLLPDSIEQELVINYLAHNVQFQGKKLQWAMILQGVQGDGKSFLAEMMKHVLGATNCRTIAVESLDEKFTGWAEGNCMVFIEEMKLDNHKKYETLNKLKPYIANPTVPIRRMQRDVYECINTTNYFALTNFKDALPIDNNDRRYCVLFSQWQSKDKLMEFLASNPDYYSSLYENMRKHAGEILDWLLRHEIPDSFKSLTRAPDTKAKIAMLEMNKGADYILVEDAIGEFECADINNHVVNITKLHKFATDGFNNGYALFPKDSRLRNILLDMGYHNIGRYKDETRKNYTIYCKDDKKKASDFKIADIENDDENLPF